MVTQQSKRSGDVLSIRLSFRQNDRLRRPLELPFDLIFKRFRSSINVEGPLELLEPLRTNDTPRRHFDNLNSVGAKFSLHTEQKQRRVRTNDKLHLGE